MVSSINCTVFWSILFPVSVTVSSESNQSKCIYVLVGTIFTAPVFENDTARYS